MHDVIGDVEKKKERKNERNVHVVQTRGKAILMMTLQTLHSIINALY